jgi:hypothetical protein
MDGGVVPFGRTERTAKSQFRTCASADGGNENGIRTDLNIDDVDRQGGWLRAMERTSRSDERGEPVGVGVLGGGGLFAL